MLLNKASCAIDAWETTTLVLVVHAHTTIFYTEGAIKVDTQSNDSSEQKAPPAKRELSQQTGHEQSMHVTKQCRLISEMVLPTIPVVLNK